MWREKFLGRVEKSKIFEIFWYYQIFLKLWRFGLKLWRFLGKTIRFLNLAVFSIVAIWRVSGGLGLSCGGKNFLGRVKKKQDF